LLDKDGIKKENYCEFSLRYKICLRYTRGGAATGSKALVLYENDKTNDHYCCY